MSVYCIVNRNIVRDDPTDKITLRAPLAYNNSLAHSMRVTVYERDGSPSDLTGVSVQGWFLRADNQTVVITGAVAGNMAEIILPQSCYVVPGRYKFTMNLNQAYTTQQVESTLAEYDADPTHTNIGKAMRAVLERGNVSLLNRPQVQASDLEAAGWENAGTGLATVFSVQYYAGEQGVTYTQNLILHMTPIMANGTIKTPAQMDDYVDALLTETSVESIINHDKVSNGGNGLILWVQQVSQQVTQQVSPIWASAEIVADQYDDYLHTMQAGYYFDETAGMPSAEQLRIIYPVTTDSAPGVSGRSALWVEGIVEKNISDTIIDPGHVVPSLAELLAQIDALETVTADARDIVSYYDAFVKVSDTQPSEAGNKIWVQPQSDEYQVPTWNEFTVLRNGYVDFGTPEKAYYKLNNDYPVGATIGNKITTGDYYHYIVELNDVIEGETFYIKATDGPTARPYAILDENRVILDKAGASGSVNKTVEIPTGGKTLIVQVRDTNISNAVCTRNTNVYALGGAISAEVTAREAGDASVMEELGGAISAESTARETGDEDVLEELDGVREKLNLFDDTLTYKQVKTDGTNDGTRSPTDGAYTCNKDDYNHGQRWWVIDGKTLPAGTYTLSAYVVLPTANNRQIRLGIGRGSGVSNISLTTERGGVENIGSEVTEGWVKRTVTLAEEYPWGVAFNPINASDRAAVISYIQLEKGDVVTPYSEDGYSAIDVRARAAIEKITSTPDIDTELTALAGNLNAQTDSNVAPKDCFLYFTDPHLLENSAKKRFEDWMDFLGYCYHHSPADFVVCGGDWIGNGDTPDEAIVKLGKAKGAMKSRFDKFHLVVGNHDTNYQGDTRLKQQAINNVWYGSKLSYYTFETENAMYVVLDTGIEASNFKNSNSYAYYKAEADWLYALLLANTHPHVVLMPHIIYSSWSDQTLSEIAKGFLDIAYAYNTSGTASITGDSGAVTYSFSGTTPAGKVEFCLAGHSHHDSAADLVVRGIPSIVRTSMRYNGPNDTLQPVCDLIAVDYTAKKVYLTRVGGRSDSGAATVVNF